MEGSGFPIGYVMASRLVADERRKVRWMYREEPDNDKDSGWRMFCGDEDAAYCENADNFGLFDAWTIAEIDPDVVPLLDSPPSSAFERRGETDPFQAAAPPDAR